MAKLVFGMIGESYAVFLEEQHNHETIFRVHVTGDHSAHVGELIQGVSFSDSKLDTTPPQYPAVLKIGTAEVPVVMGEVQSIMLQSLATPEPIFES